MRVRLRPTMSRSVLAALLVMLVGAPSISAQDFHSGELRMCVVGGRCVSVVGHPS